MMKRKKKMKRKKRNLPRLLLLSSRMMKREPMMKRKKEMSKKMTKKEKKRSILPLLLLSSHTYYADICSHQHWFPFPVSIVAQLCSHRWRQSHWTNHERGVVKVSQRNPTRGNVAEIEGCLSPTEGGGCSSTVSLLFDVVVVIVFVFLG
jgi:hypothetical protein